MLTAYGKQAITSSVGTPRPRSVVGFNRGFTGYVADQETGLAFARTRMYSPQLGRFIGRDSMEYSDGFALYSAYFCPNGLDPSGTMICAVICGGAENVVKDYWEVVIKSVTKDEETGGYGEIFTGRRPGWKSGSIFYNQQYRTRDKTTKVNRHFCDCKLCSWLMKEHTEDSDPWYEYGKWGPWKWSWSVTIFW